VCSKKVLASLPGLGDESKDKVHFGSIGLSNLKQSDPLEVATQHLLNG
jgi:hypothetical protein